ncbi:amidase domain-containing protein [Streptomyces phaeofaciens]|uniref:amidase domain-containing protein n=1 Tax=Streptomyces phaeofaciens TaxID=68254 RepID=UPI00167A6613|nr:amidase domain-containing protein [Streptomyces phaeofaciens]
MSHSPRPWRDRPRTRANAAAARCRRGVVRFYGPTSLWTSYTWGGAENWYWFAIKHSKRTKALRNVDDLLASDVLQADRNRNNVIDHSMFVTKKYRGMPYLTYHSSNTHNKPVSTLVSDHPNTWWYAHRT